MKKHLAFILTAAMLILPLAACSTTPSGGTATTTAGSGSGDNVIKVGVFEPVTGENGGGGFQEVLGIRYANQEKPTVDIGGQTYKVELVEVDNKSDKTEAVSAAQSLVSSGVSVILGSYGSGVSIAAGDIFEEAKIPAIGVSCTNPQVTSGNDYYFRVCFIDPFQGTVMANYAWGEGAKTAAVITQLGDDYSSGLGSYFTSSFKALGGTIADEEQFQTNQTDFKAILTNIKAANPDIIFAPSSIATAPLIIKQARELGITAPITAGDTWENASIIENAGDDAEGVALSTFFDEGDTSNTVATAFLSGFKAFLNADKSYLEKNGGEAVAAVSALGYDAYNVALEAIKGAGSTDSQAIRDALVNVDYTGVTGNITFDSNGDANKNIAYIKTIKDGAFTFLKTVEIADTGSAETTAAN
ncbi:ABC transporter substrate-binding protein [Oscillospiraceae bacterium HV4-5-C5C]|nr:ABC transporter substrate-binding protein [Oscillospiraceae bacterium HV4-5-C5C]